MRGCPRGRTSCPRPWRATRETAPKTDGPDLELLREVVAAFPGVPVICEGRVHTPEQAAAVAKAGAFAAHQHHDHAPRHVDHTQFYAAVEG